MDAIAMVHDMLDIYAPTRPMPDFSACRERLQNTVVFAAQAGATEQLARKLEYLATYGQAAGAKTRCRLFGDFAPHSFLFTIEKQEADGTWKPWLGGGLIYDGPGQPLDGSLPALTVRIGSRTCQHDWSVHT